jgi:DNA polymerase III epsilon subunit-like protein
LSRIANSSGCTHRVPCSSACSAIGLSLHQAHSALHDARATAQLLAAYLDPS